jgi:hypothetical protein
MKCFWECVRGHEIENDPGVLKKPRALLNYARRGCRVMLIEGRTYA